MITALLFSVLTGSVALQPDDGWLAWQGCWRSVDDDMTSLLCIVPEGNGVRMITLVDGTKRSEVTLIADGVARPISQEGCSGTQEARWSADRQRLFLKTNMACGETVQRNVAGIMSMQSANEWLSIHAVTAGTNTSTQVERYRAIEVADLPADIAATLRANRLARETARNASSATVDLDDVQEAAKVAQTAATVTWLSAMEQEFDLDGKKLIALADAGVSAEVIDALVAVSNPQYFAMDARVRDDDYERRYPTSRCYDRYYDPWFGYGDCGRYYGWGRRGYGGWGYYGTPVIIVRGRDTQNPAAKVTRKGYKKGDSDSSTPSTSSTPSSSKPSSSGSSGSGDKDKSSGGSSGSGRTAKPRGT
jgi:hypothetical protein